MTDQHELSTITFDDFFLGEMTDSLVDTLDDAIGDIVLTPDGDRGVLVQWSRHYALVYEQGNLVEYPPLSVVPVDSDLAPLIQAMRVTL
jgi:hypothetical protein